MSVCRGPYSGTLVQRWREWDEKNGSENDCPDFLLPEQLYIVFVVSDGGTDLERFEVRTFEEARSMLLQVRSLDRIPQNNGGHCAVRPSRHTHCCRPVTDAAAKPWPLAFF